jgi:DNA-binding MarR family transcriptional regulator/N-acetylglutamate synthase-like GNAT family acetyltransferase
LTESTIIAVVSLDTRVATVRAFNRFYTNAIGVLQERFLHTPYSLAEARVLFELAQAERVEVADLRRTLDMDAGYLSRILGRFDVAGLVERERSAADARRQVVRLTERGREAFAVLDERSAARAFALLGRLDDGAQRRLVSSMDAIRTLLRGAAASEVVLREPRPGDYGWAIGRHGALYAEEYGWDASVETFIAGIVSGYLASRDPACESAWIAELDGRRAGCVFCVRREERVAQLRLLLVEPWARGAGIGGRLVDECLAFARRAGYERIVLWTNDVLVEARRLYERAGFELVAQAPHHAFGRDLVEQTWALEL